MTRVSRRKTTAKTSPRKRLSHIDAKGHARMVDVGEKKATRREAIARGVVHMQPETLERILTGRIEKGEVLAVARIAAVMAAKRTAEIIPLCHPLPLEVVRVDFDAIDRYRLEIGARVRVTARTGVEMEALTAVSAAALTIYDMCKAIDRGMMIEQIALLEKSGGRSGRFRRKAGA